MKINYGPIWNAAGSLIYGLNSFIMLALVSRVGTVEQAGCFGIAFTTAQILYIVGLLGVPHYQMTDYGERYRFSEYARLRVFSCGLMVLGCIGAVIGLRFTGKKAVYTVALTILMLLNVVGELYQSLFFQKNRLDLSGSALFYRTFWPLLLFCGVLWMTREVLAAIAAQILANLLLTLYYALRVAPQFIQAPTEKTPGNARALLAECCPLFISLLLMNIVINASKYGVELAMDDQAQGYYNMIFMPAQVINLCSQFLFKPLLNRYAALLTQKRDGAFRRLFLGQLALVAALTVLCCVGAFWLGCPVLSLLYQKDIAPLRSHLTFIVLGGGVFAACQLYYYVLVILRKQRLIMGIYFGISAVAVPMTAAWVGWGGLLGAAISFVVVHLLLMLCYMGGLHLILRRGERG